jgi:Rad3-related DNA helicase
LKICPYYQNKMAAVDGDLILMPYNYLLSKRLREGMGLKLKDSIIIIDEAHNIANAAESVMEVEIRETTIDVIISELRSYANHTTVKHTRVREILEIINRFRTGL